MDRRTTRTIDVLRALVHEIRIEKIPFLAGSIAYHAFVSLLPLFALLLYIASGLGNATMQAGLIRLSRAVFTEGAQEVLIAEIMQSSQSVGVSVLGIVLLVWGTLRIFRGLDTAFSDIYETEAENTFIDQLSDGILVLVTFVVAVVVAIMVYVAIPEGPLVRPFVLVFGLVVTLLPMYYVFPDTNVSVREVLPGTILAAIGLTVFQGLFRLYASSGEQNVVAGILLLLTMLYVSGFVILLGVVVNAVLSNRSADVSIDPVIGGIERTGKSEYGSRDELRERLVHLQGLLGTPQFVEITVRDTTIALPPPQSVEISTSDRLLAFGDAGPLELTLRWSVSDGKRDQTTTADATED